MLAIDDITTAIPSKNDLVCRRPTHPLMPSRHDQSNSELVLPIGSTFNLYAKTEILSLHPHRMILTAIFSHDFLFNIRLIPNPKITT